MATPGTSTLSTFGQSKWQNASVGDFVVESEVGKGSFAKVYMGWHKESKAIVAIKSVDLEKLSKKLKENLYSEIQILKTLRHPHIVALHDCIETPSHINLVMEYCELGDLSLFIKKRDKLLTHPVTHDMARKYPCVQNSGLHEVVIRHFLKQLASALQFLRSKNYVHRDVKPQNLLLLASSQHRPTHSRPILMTSLDSLIPVAGLVSLPMLKLADFGFARVLPSTTLADTLCGSPLYMAPEILRYERYDAKADLWSVGTVLYEMVTGRPPTRARNHVELLRKIEAAQDVVKFPREAIVSSDMKSLIRSLLKRHPVERLGFEYFFNHSVVTNPIPGLIEDDIPLAPSDGRPSAVARPYSTGPAVAGSSAPSAVVPAFIRPSSVGPAATINSAGPIVTTSFLSRRLSRQGDLEPHTAPAPVSPWERPLPSPIKSGSPIIEGRPARTRVNSNVSRQTYSPSAEVNASDDMEIRSKSILSVSRSGRMSDASSAKHFAMAINASPILARAATEEEKAEQDVQDMRDYVVIEKKQVEINALADDIEVNRKLGPRGQSLQTTGPMVRRNTYQDVLSSATVGTTNLPTGHPSSTSSSNRSNNSSASPGSASGALTKAIHDASVRLFGYYKLRDRLGPRQSPPQYNPFPTYVIPPLPLGLNLIGDGKLVNTSGTEEDMHVVQVVEELATRSNVVYCFAEVKFKQLFPSTPQHGGVGTPTVEQASSEDEDLTTEAVVNLAEEAFVLYFKVLNLLARAMDIANMWWSRKRFGAEPTNLTPVASTRDMSSYVQIQRLNSVVQWIRTRFNEVLEKTELVQLKLIEGQKRLPEEHPNHPNNHGYDYAVSTGSGPKVPFLSPGISAEKLIYERALDMGRTAAIHEVSNQDPAGCEISYLTALHMLEVVLDGDGNSLQKTLSFGGKEMREDSRDEGSSRLDNDDKQIVRKMIQMITTRLATIRKKMLDIAESEKEVQSHHSATTRRRSGDGTPRSLVSA